MTLEELNRIFKENNIPENVDITIYTPNNVKTSRQWDISKILYNGYNVILYKDFTWDMTIDIESRYKVVYDKNKHDQ